MLFRITKLIALSLIILLFPFYFRGSRLSAAGEDIAASEEESSALDAQLALYDPKLAINREGFSLFVLDEHGEISSELRRYYELRVKTLMNGDTFVSIVAKNLPASAGSLFILKYHPSDFKLKEINPGKAYGGKDESVFLAVRGFVGGIPISVARIRPNEKGFITGDGLVAEALFVPGPETGNLPIPFTAEAPAVEVSGLTVTNEGANNLIEWEEKLVGDYDNDGDVDPADVIPIAEHFYGELGDGLNDDVESYLDGNKDGIIDTKDITMVASNMFAKVIGYNVYRGTKGGGVDVKLLHPDPQTETTVVRGTREAFQSANFSVLDNSFSEEMPESGRSTFAYKVVPVGPTGESRTHFIATIDFGYGADVTPPHDNEDRLKPFRGVVRVDPGDSRLKITYKLDASDIHVSGVYSPPGEIRYFLFLGYRDDETGLLDFTRLLTEENGREITGEPGPFIWDDLNLRTQEKEPLVNGEEYAVFISAQDEAGNRTAPEIGNVAFGKPVKDSHNDFEPPSWVGGERVVRIIAGDSGVRVEFSSAEDLVSPPVRYRLYYSTKGSVNPLSDVFVEVSNSPHSLIGLANGTRYSFLLRAIDSADRFYPPIEPNETKNTDVLSATPLEGAGDVTPPIWSGNAGVHDLVPGDGSVRVEFGEAVDESSHVSYVIYYEEGKEITFSKTTARFPVPRNYPPTFLEGLQNGKEYAVLVRAVDEEGNEEKNNVVLTVIPDRSLDNRPPKWDKPGVSAVTPLNSAVGVFWESAEDESPPVRYRVYWEEGVDGVSDYALAVAEGRYLDVSETYCTVNGLENGKTYSFAVRARDSAEPSNEDFNQSFLTCEPIPSPQMVVEPVTEVGGKAVSTSIAIMPKTNSPAIAITTRSDGYAGEGELELYYTHKMDNLWKVERVTGGIRSKDPTVSLRFNEQGTPYIVYARGVLGNDGHYHSSVELAYRDERGKWNFQTIEKGEKDRYFVSPSLALSSRGEIAVAYLAVNPNQTPTSQLMFASSRDGEWERQVVLHSPRSAGTRIENLQLCDLAFGTFDVEGVLRERASLAFSGFSEPHGLYLVFEGESKKWDVWQVDTGGNASQIRLAFLTERREDKTAMSWPVISYLLRDEIGKQALYLASLMVKEQEGRRGLFWKKVKVQDVSPEALPFPTALGILKKGQRGFPVTYVLWKEETPPLARMAIENLYSGEFTTFTLPIIGPVDTGIGLSLAKSMLVNDAEKAYISLVSKNKIWLMREE